MFDLFLILLTIVVLYYHMTHCGKCRYTNTRCDLCDYGKKYALKYKEMLEERRKNESL